MRHWKLHSNLLWSFAGNTGNLLIDLEKNTLSSCLQIWKTNLDSCFFFHMRQVANTLSVFFTHYVTGRPLDHPPLSSYPLAWNRVNRVVWVALEVMYSLKLPLESKGQQLFYCWANCTWISHSFLQLPLLLVRVVLLVSFFYKKHCELFPYASGESQPGRNNV